MPTERSGKPRTSSEDEAIAVVSPRGPQNLFEASEAITAENVHRYRSDPTDIAAAREELTKLGFRVVQEGSTTISIAGSPKRFKEAFGVPLKKDAQPLSQRAPDHTREFFVPDVSDPEQHLLQAPEPLTPLIEGVAMARPPEIHESPVPPLAPVDPAAYRYLLVPDDVALVIRATRTHRLGTTGLGVVIAMIDTGHYSHPWFGYHGFRVLPTLLGPGEADPSEDTYGHGTGESANIFSAAPDCRLRPIKGLNDPTGSFNVAVTSSPQPRVISNSWGYDIDYPGAVLDPYLKTLEAAVANAVASGIVVCFSAGNGGQGFPACMPDVIAVGGVHVNYPDLSLEASSYASSFDSSLYPGRHVPDLCGITGKLVDINGAKAPSHLLPVQPGATLDAILPSTGADDDGWGLFSGTSAACPLVAGVAALVIGRAPTKSPAEVKSALVKSAIDVKAGATQQGDVAGPGWDNATGAGLVDAKYAWLMTMGDLAADFFAAPADVQVEMVRNGQMPQLTPEFAEDVITTLRSR
jgi:subtilisin family serine protease